MYVVRCSAASLSTPGPSNRSSSPFAAPIAEMMLSTTPEAGSRPTATSASSTHWRSVSVVTRVPRQSKITTSVTEPPY
jgi:hypothetical protein